jgi:hypothetical protein
MIFFQGTLINLSENDLNQFEIYILDHANLDMLH